MGDEEPDGVPERPGTHAGRDAYVAGGNIEITIVSPLPGDESGRREAGLRGAAMARQAAGELRESVRVHEDLAAGMEEIISRLARAAGALRAERDVLRRQVADLQDSSRVLSEQAQAEARELRGQLRDLQGRLGHAERLRAEMSRRLADSERQLLLAERLRDEAVARERDYTGGGAQPSPPAGGEEALGGAALMGGPDQQAVEAVLGHVDRVLEQQARKLSQLSEDLGLAREDEARGLPGTIADPRAAAEENPLPAAGPADEPARATAERETRRQAGDLVGGGRPAAPAASTSALTRESTADAPADRPPDQPLTSMVDPRPSGAPDGRVPVAARRPTRSARRWNGPGGIAVGAVLVAAALVTVIFSLSPGGPLGHTGAPPATAGSHAGTTTGGSVRATGSASPLAESPVGVFGDPSKNELSGVTLSSSGKEVAVWDLGGSTVSNLRSVAATGAVGNVYVWNSTSHALIGNFKNPDGSPPGAAAFAPGGKILAVADGNFTGRTYLWDIASHKVIAELRPVTTISPIEVLAYSPDGSILAVGDAYGTIYLYSMNRHTFAQMENPLGGGSQGLVSITFSPDSRSLAIIDGRGGAYLINVARHSFAAHVNPAGMPKITAVSFSADNRTIALIGPSSKVVQLWDVAARRVVGTISEPGHSPAEVAYSPDGKIVAIGDTDSKEIYLEATVSHKVVGTLPHYQPGEPNPPSFLFSEAGLAFDSTGKYLATYAAPTTAYLYNVASAEG